MNIAKTHLSSTIKSSFLQTFTSKPTITLTILDTLLQKCKNVKEFNQIHSQMIISGYINDTFAASRLLKFSTDSYFIPINHSHYILDSIKNPNGFIWNTMMRAYLQRDFAQATLSLYRVMLEKNVEPDNYTYPILIQACSVRFNGFEGKEIHTHVLKLGFGSDVYVVNTLINMYAVCGNVSEARQLFDEACVIDSVSWNSILAGYVQIGDVEEAVLVFDQMPDKNTIASNSMIALFGKMGRVNDARRLFDGMVIRDMVTWTAILSCYEQNEMFEQALAIFVQMRVEGVAVDEVVVVSALSACANLLANKEGELVHSLSMRIGIESYVNLHNALIHMYSRCGNIIASRKLFDTSHILDQISWNSMISGYLKCGSVDEARALFDCMPTKDVVSWSAMISGYAQHDYFTETLALFHEMQLTGIRPDETTLVSVISACTHLAALDQGKWIHTYIKKNDLKINTVLGTTLIDMYMKCGCVENALEIFQGMEEKGVSSWNTIILGLAVNGLVEESLDKFSEMKRCNVAPNEITFMGVLGACRHVGLVDDGRHFFESMVRIHNITPNVKHYGCMVDLLGRAGLLQEAEELIESMPISPDVATWGALLGACKKHRNTQMAERIGRKLIQLQPENDGFHVLLSNVYASKGRWDDVIEIRDMMKHQGVVKIPGCSIIEADGVVHEFLAGDTTHPRMKEIDKMLDEMAQRLKMEGYSPDTNEVTLDIDEEEKETNLYRHSEKLAIAFGMICTSPRTPIRIMKNLRICDDCHSAAIAISSAYEREIVIRDRHRFHHFKKGSCSCMGYW
ncbi:hypothetical protein AQUCO_00300454v1 [Aquilegia coerulea]|uniref:DYW domain-containing protein n=1 Tax=Aquilegia coerulea TaxID=218851 RepID=A0A2G5EYZ2_AQUCA|nr:hypothetical protein AQUCO_00300454v1 [Aquilegia coerulea]